MSNKLSTDRTTAAQNQLSFTRVIAILVAFLAMLGSFSDTAAGQMRRPTANRLVPQGSTEPASVMFRSGRDLITEGQWAKAQETFDQYVARYPNEKNLDVALYWMAYAEYKLAKFDLCKNTVERLLEKYPSSPWRDDARVLLAQVPGVYTSQAAPAAELTAPTRAAQERVREATDVIVVETPAPARRPVASGQTVTTTRGPAIPLGGQNYWLIDGPPGGSPDDSDDPCEFKIVVLQALFETDVQRGVVAATEWLKPGSAQTVRCKSAALSLLGRNGGKAVTPVILNFARTESDARLKARAISALGATNDDSVVEALRDFALNSTDPGIVEASLSALSRHTSDQAIGVLTDIAISGKVLSQRRIAISSIASRKGEPAVDALLRIYDADQSVEIRKFVISGFGNRISERAGNKLFEIARTSDNTALRVAAINAISRRGGDKAVEFLLSLYDTEKNEEVKDQIVSALGVGNVLYAPGPVVYGGQGGPGAFPTPVTPAPGGRRAEDPRVGQKLIEIARNPKESMERRKRAIGYLSRSKDPRVIKFLEELLSQQQ